MTDSNGDEQALVIGAGSAIGAALVDQWSASGRFKRVWAISRNSPQSVAPPRVCLATDHSAEQIEELVARIHDESPGLRRVVIALGTLHGEGYQPEKSLDSLDRAAMQQVHFVNFVLTMLSARVGSIGDNRLGGWYSYRSSKAALNMGLKCAAIELARRAKGCKLIAFHPGTVDSPLSRPFQRGVPAHKLFSCETAAQRLDEVLDRNPADGELAYLDWSGKPIPW